MISKSQVQLITSLHHKKFRKEKKLFIAEGEKTVKDLMTSGWKVQAVYLIKEFHDEEFKKWKASKSLQVQIISEKELEKISALTTPQSILAVAEIPDNKFDPVILKGKLSLVLDEIKDPGNMGTLIRIADWFGIEHILCSENCADIFSPKVVQAAMGSLFRVSVFSCDLSELLLINQKQMQLPVYGTFLDGENIYSSSLSPDGLILIGNESKGISDELQPFVNHKISIPAFSNSKTNGPDSLNAAVAAAVVCSEFKRLLNL